MQADKASVNGYTGAIVAKNVEVHYGVSGVVMGSDVQNRRKASILNTMQQYATITGL